MHSSSSTLGSDTSSQGRSKSGSAWETRKEVVITVFGIALLFTLGLAVANGISALIAGEVTQASDYASFASGLATMVLVGVTGWYTFVTRQLVSESRKERIQNQQYKKEQFNRKKEALRRAFKHEIKSIGNYEEFLEADEGKVSPLREVAPTAVYKANADELGLLSNEEVAAITEYYRAVIHIENVLAAVRNNESYTWEKNKDHMEDVIEAQNEAVSILDHHLEKEEETA